MLQNPNAHLRLLLKESGWNGTQLAAAVRTVAAEHHHNLACDRSTVSRWLSGTQPRPPAPAFLTEALARRLGRPVTAQEAGLTRAPDPVVDLSWEADPLRKLAALSHADLNPTRRHLLGTGVFSLAALSVPDLADLPRFGHAADRTLTVHRAGRGELEEMQTMAKAFADAAEAHGGGHVRTALAAYLAHDVSCWLHAPAKDAVRCRLLSAAAQLTILLGTMCADDGADAEAQHYHRIAAHAHDIGHRGPAVVNLAQRAADRARSASPIVLAYTQAHLAVTQARHDRHAALTALTAAERLHSRADTTPGPFTNYPLAALCYQRAQSLTALADHPGAVAALRTSLRLRTPGERHARILTHARLGESLLTIGHLEAALPHWQAFLDGYAFLHSARTTRQLDVMRRCLRPHQQHRGVKPLLARARVLR